MACNRLGVGRGPASFGQANRSPAAIQKVFDFSSLEGAALQSAAKKRLLSGLDIETRRQEGEVIIEMGNFVLLNEKNEKDFACGFYDRFTLSFEAEGVSGSGEKPTLAIEARCEVGENINFMVPVRIPFAKILGEDPGNAEYKFFDGPSPVTVRFSNTASAWPKRWVLRNIKMVHSRASSRVLLVQATDLVPGTLRPLGMNW